MEIAILGNQKKLWNKPETLLRIYHSNNSQYSPKQYNMDESNHNHVPPDEMEAANQ
jgi:hypothetical protein